MKHDSIESCRQFMEAAGQEVKPFPGQPSVEVLKLRLSLELEELYEKAQAFGLEGTFQQMLEKRIPEVMCRESNGVMYDYFEDTEIYDAVAVLDACADQRVVADGTILACGLQDVFDAAMDDVSSSNMSKFPETNELCKATVSQYQGNNIAVEASRIGTGAWVVRRASDGKILKSINYRPANMQAVLNAQYPETSDV